jgi:hypothetical protein
MMMTQRIDNVISSYKCLVHRLPNTVMAVFAEVTLPGSVYKEQATDTVETTGAVRENLAFKDQSTSS